MSRTGNLSLIAQRAGCSVSTVSRVLNGYREGFSARPELQERIKEAARQLDYKPNIFWRTMRAKRTKMIAIMSFPYRNWEMSDGAIAFIDEIRKAGYSEAIKYVKHDRREDFKIDFPVDAALFSDIFDLSFLDVIERESIPYVVVNGVSGPHGASLMIDEREGAEALLGHLVSLGHRSIAYANNIDANPLQRHHSVEERERFYLEGLRSRGLKPLPNHWSHEIPSDEFLKEALEAGATAIVCYHHLRAVEIAHSAWKAGVRIPEQLSLACFNDDWSIQLSNPPLTCISFPRDEINVKAAGLLLSALSGGAPLTGQTLRFPGSLTARESTAAPRRNP